MNSISDLFDASDRGDPAAARALFAALYDELHELAARQLRDEQRDSLPFLLHEPFDDH